MGLLMSHRVTCRLYVGSMVGLLQPPPRTLLSSANAQIRLGPRDCRWDLDMWVRSMDRGPQLHSHAPNDNRTEWTVGLFMVCWSR